MGWIANDTNMFVQNMMPEPVSCPGAQSETRVHSEHALKVAVFVMR